MPTGIKHLVKCRCILPQFKKAFSPPNHQFIVFSVIDDKDNVVPKIVVCNNCGIVHKVVDITKSIIVNGKENLTTLVTAEEIACCLPEKLVSVLDANHVDVPTWEAVKFTFENKQWGNMVVLSGETIDDERTGKYIVLLSETAFRVESFSRKEVAQ
jgi:hypothetical protein